MQKTTKVVIMGIDTNHLPKLTSSETDELLVQIAKGDKDARERFVGSNLKLVLSICKKFRGRSEDIDDIFQVGIVGLCKAVDNFQPQFGVRFSTYAVPMIIGEIKRYLRDTSIIRVSRGLRDIAYQSLLIRDKLRTDTTDPTLDEIASALNLKNTIVKTALDAVSEPISIFTSANGMSDEKLTLADMLYDEQESGDNNLKRICLKEALNALDPREKEIIDLRYFEGKTQIEVSDEIGISQAQVSRLEKNALKVLGLYV